MLKPIAAVLAPEVEGVRRTRSQQFRDADAAIVKSFSPQSQKQRNAEIVEGCDPIWVVIEIIARMHADVYKELVGHRFGIYVPEVDETVIKRGRKIDRRVPLFSSYMFVFYWPSDRHWSLIANTPGIVEIVGKLSEAEIDIVRAVENQKRPVTIELPADQPAEVVPVKKSKKKKRWKGRKAKGKTKKPKVITEDDLRNEIITTRAWSAFDDILELDSEGRNQTLRKALGLA